MDNSTLIPVIGSSIGNSIGPLLGAIVGFIGALILEKYKESKKQKTGIQKIECCEKINQGILDRNSLGPAAGIQIKAEEAGPGSKLIDVDHIYIAVYRLRNLSNVPVERISLRLENNPNSMWFDIKEGDTRTPDWDNLKKQIIQESKVSKDFIIPYLNPYPTTKHEAFLELASYLPLDSIKILGGGKGIDFNFSKPCEERIDTWSRYLSSSLGFAFMPAVFVSVVRFLAEVFGGKKQKD